MHQSESNRQRRDASLGKQLAGWLLLLTWIAPGIACAAEPAGRQPGAAVMAPVNGLVAFMTKLPANVHPDVFTKTGLVIVENFPPYIFRGSDAAARWEAGFRAHAVDEDLSDLAVKFAEAHDFTVSGHLAYISLPTTWTGLTHGRRFEERGAWAFVLQEGSGGWRILGYGWGEISHTESTP